MGLSYICEYANSRLYHLLKSNHLTGLGYSCFKNRHTMAGVKLPNRQWYTYLGIVTLRARRHASFGGKKLDQPIFNNSLSVAARNTYDRDIVKRTMP